MPVKSRSTPQTPNARSDAEGENGLQAVRAPTVSLPKGGGAIRGIGEKFTANPVTGTGAFTVPIATSPGRSGFGPQLQLAYDSGAGNGPFGLGWTLSLPSITRKTDKGLPRYGDADESDVFLLSGAEDLVPRLVEDGAAGWRRDAFTRTVGTTEFRVERYRPRVEGSFARIERWTRVDTGETHWRTISRDNVTTLYGRTPESRIADPADPSKVFSWLACESHDDKGNALRYEHKEEDSANVDTSSAHEANRAAAARASNRYLKRIKYGNRTPSVSGEDLSERSDWLFEVVLDYGEHYAEDDEGRATASIQDERPWSARVDPFSSYRAGFEVRTYRVCRRVLVFHHFPEELGTADYLVRATHLSYRETAAASFLTSVKQSGYLRKEAADGTAHYVQRSLPPIDLSYSEPSVDEEVRDVDPVSVADLPQGVDGSAYRWVDLDGEGLPGVLTEQGGTWFYKRSEGALQVEGGGAGPPRARLAPAEPLRTVPSLANLASGRQQLLDLEGDGRLEVVELEGPTPGRIDRTEDEGWGTFVPFESLPQVPWMDPNLRFIDLTGDGRADVVISEDEVLAWYPSLGDDGFGPRQEVRNPLDEKRGPRLVFADGTESVYAADMSGDGLADLARIRNGEICYWPNLGHGRFGPKVTMDDAPWFDPADVFEQRRIRLADIDGSGTTDVIYLARDGVRFWFNLSGNRWSAPRRLPAYPRVDELSSVAAVDLLGTGTACLVWSSPLPGDGRRPMRYVDLMGGQKPHLLTRIVNNLGAETTISYAPSTRFYLADRRAGRPWITRLPFPVHCVERVAVRDRWRGTEFATTYSYHHGYFDGVEREFRGFGRVEQVDVEAYGEFARGSAASPYVTDDHRLFQPPVKTVTWNHTGAAVDRETILSLFEEEYFPAGRTGGGAGGFREIALPEPGLDPLALSAEEWREALRACRGMTLRQETYELDVDALERGEHVPVKLFSAAYHNCHVRRVQPRLGNRHASFLVTESEAVTYQYDLDLRGAPLAPDPRVAHAFNLRTDEYGNVLQAVSVVHPRLGRHADEDLSADQLAAIDAVQGELHVAYTETRYTNDVDLEDDHRPRVPCEVATFELTGVKPADGRLHFTIDELRSYRLSDFHQTAGTAVTSIPYHQLPTRTQPEKRIVEKVRHLFFAEDLQSPLAFGVQNRLGLPFESYRLALTDELLSAVLGTKLTTAIAQALSNPATSGYLSGQALAGRFAPEPTTAERWASSGRAGFAADASLHFYLPERYTDPFGSVTSLEYDARYDLYVRSSVDPLGNTVSVEAFDFRVLSPRSVKDANENLSEAFFDVLGMPVALAVEGKGTEGDSFQGFDDDLANPDLDARVAFFGGTYDAGEARRLLGKATVRHVYHFGEMRRADGGVEWASHPACACGIRREQHVARLGKGEETEVQAAFEYTDGLGAVLVTKSQAEPEPGGTEPRWIASGKTVLNNKGKPVKQYEPYFSESGHRFEEPGEVGVTPVLYYDGPGRLVRTEQPDGSYSRVELSPWHVETWDRNDTVLDPGNAWYAAASAASATAAQRRAASLAAAHAGTPATTILDSLGREVIAIAHNRVDDGTGGIRDEKYLTRTRLDAEGKPLWIRDARNNLVMQYVAPPMPDAQAADATTGFVPAYDLAGNLLFQHGMDGGDRWMLPDAAGNPLFAWDLNQRQEPDGTLVNEERRFVTSYDALRRPTHRWMAVAAAAPRLLERLEYGESRADAKARNLRGRLWRQYDPSGLREVVQVDFDGNAREVRRTLAKDHRAAIVDWQTAAPGDELESESFIQITEHDALGRVTRQFQWHRGQGARVAVLEPQYNERGLLASEDLVLRATKEDPSANPKGYSEDPAHPAVKVIREITYDAKGQRQAIVRGNETVTRYAYDPETFRLLQLRTTRPGFDPVFPNASPALKDDRVLQNLHYTYDPEGNITEIRDDAFEPAFFKNQKVKAESRYEYDALYRLVGATGREGTASSGAPGQIEGAPAEVQFPITDPDGLRNYAETYAYDPAGNILETKHVAAGGSWTRHQAYAADSNRLVSMWVGTSAIGSTQYRYDTHGNMLNLANIAPGQYVRWDHRDMIHALDLQGGGFAYYAYDARKQRTRKVIESQSGTKQWERIYLGGLEIYRRYLGGAVVEEIESVHVMDGEQRVLLVDDVLATDKVALGVRPLYRYQYGNHLGSLCLEADETTAIISYDEFHPYGTSAYRLTNGAIEVPPARYRFTGMERDEESGLATHGVRQYSPTIARWVSVDPASRTPAHNAYDYADALPTGKRDSSGMAPLGIEGMIDTYRRLRRLNAPGMEREHAFPKALMLYIARSIYGQRAADAFRKFMEDESPAILTNKAVSRPKTLGPSGDLSVIGHERTHLQKDQLTPAGELLANRTDKFKSAITEGQRAGRTTLTMAQADVVIDKQRRFFEGRVLLGIQTWKRLSDTYLSRLMNTARNAAARAQRSAGNAASGNVPRGFIDLRILGSALTGARAFVSTAAKSMIPGSEFYDYTKYVVGGGSLRLGMHSLGLGARLPIASGAAQVGVEGGAVVAAAGSVVLAGATIQAVANEERTPVEVADRYYGTGFADTMTWLRDKPWVPRWAVAIEEMKQDLYYRLFQSGP